MTRPIRAELLKLRTARVNYGLLLTSAALTALFATLEAYGREMARAPWRRSRPRRD
jgi:hypothetical protein